VVECRIAQRAEQITATVAGGDDVDHWLRADVDLLIAERARRLQPHRRPEATWTTGWAAQREDLTRLRAREIALGPDPGGDLDNWLRAEREVLR